MDGNLLSECLELEDMFIPLLIASEQSTPEKALETLVKTSETQAGREGAACKYALVTALELCRNLSYASSSHLLSLTLELIRNLCNWNEANQNSFLEQDGVGVVLSILDGIEISDSNLAIISMVLQVLAKVVTGGEVHKVDIWSRLFPNKFLELARVRETETWDPLSVVFYTCCDLEGLFDELLGDEGLSLMAEIVRTVSLVGGNSDRNRLKRLISKICFKVNKFPELFSKFFSGEIIEYVSPEGGIEKSPVKSLLSKICFEINKFQELFSKFFSGEITENGTPVSTTAFGEEQAFMLELLSSELLFQKSIQSKFPSALLEIVKQAAEAVDLLPKDESGVPMKSATLDVLMFSLTMLRDICANEKESMSSVIDFVLSLGLIELMLSLPSELEPPEKIKQAMEEREDEEETIFLPSKPCPYEGFRTNVVSVIAHCVFQRKSVQDEVRERRGIPLLLQHCVDDKNNPLLREWGIRAVRNLLEGNFENKKLVAKSELWGIVDLPESSEIHSKVMFTGIQI